MEEIIETEGVTPSENDAKEDPVSKQGGLDINLSSFATPAQEAVIKDKETKTDIKEEDSEDEASTAKHNVTVAQNNTTKVTNEW
jgi:hypothetical protein